MIVENSQTFGQASLNVAMTGDGPPLVLLHGVLRAWQDFANVLASLSSQHQLLAVDFRGHGRSAPAAAYRVVDYVSDTVELLRHGLDRPAVLLGHSLGAMVALAAAAELPDRVRGVILEDPPFETMGSRIADRGFLSYFEQLQALALLRLPVPQLAGRMSEIQAPGHTAAGLRLADVRDAASLRFAAHCLAAADPQVLAPIVQGAWLRGYNLASVLDRVRCPVLLFESDSAVGGMLAEADARQICSSLADCTHVRLANVGHHIHWQQPEATLRIVHAFLATLEPAASDGAQSRDTR
ncbi:MAG TPA: alpha/beta hydrolase [Pirellulales bacterium]|jgi:pimeloyl-ACP methyl ester carboxylesterase|nr:alpha/beta hydrolase [Pirellulales bacterium]